MGAGDSGRILTTAVKDAFRERRLRHTARALRNSRNPDREDAQPALPLITDAWPLKVGLDDGSQCR